MLTTRDIDEHSTFWIRPWTKVMLTNVDVDKLKQRVAWSKASSMTQ